MPDETTPFCEEIRKDIECPVCLQVPAEFPVHQCDNGHLLCKSCRQELKNCPVCRVPIGRSISVLARTLIERYATPCRFASSGCDALMRKDQLEAHEAKCIIKSIPCPILNCSQPVSTTLIKNHLKLHGSQYYDTIPLEKKGYLFHWYLTRESLTEKNRLFNSFYEFFYGKTLLDDFTDITKCFSVKEFKEALFVFKFCVSKGFSYAWVFFYNTTQAELDKYQCSLINLSKETGRNGYILPMIPIETPSMDVIKNGWCKTTANIKSFEPFFDSECKVLLANRMMIKELDEPVAAKKV